jgi:hypothetical protein
VPSEPPTDETGCSSSQDEKRIPTDNGLYGTPRADLAKVTSLESKALAERVHKYGNLEEQIAYQLQNELLPTPITSDSQGGARKIGEDGRTHRQSSKENFSASLKDKAAAMLLPTPVVMEDRRKIYGEKAEDEHRTEKMLSNLNPYSIAAGFGTTVENLLPTPVSQGLKVCDENGKTQFIDLDILPTPAARDWKGKTNPGVVKSGSGCIYGETLPDTIDRLTKQSQGVAAGQTSRLSPLFTEEMMGFPLMWTALPFLSESGEPKPSKPTATPSSPK